MLERFELGIALIESVVENDVSSVRHLLELGADPNFSADIAAVTPLFFAVQQSSVELILLLVTAGADIETQNADNETLFQIAWLHARFDLFVLWSKLVKGSQTIHQQQFFQQAYESMNGLEFTARKPILKRAVWQAIAFIHLILAMVAGAGNWYNVQTKLVA